MIDDPNVAASTVLDLVRAVCEELRLNQTRRDEISLDASFDRDLGLDSLGRVELIARVEKMFAVTLSERIIATAETPRDVLRAVIKSIGGKALQFSVDTIDVASSAAAPAPTSAGSLAEVLRWHVDQHPERAHIQFYDDYTDGEIITYRGLWEMALSVAGGLQQLGLEAGDRVSLMLPTGRDYFFAFFGVVLAGGVPVPIYPPVRRTQLEDHLRRQSGILRNCRAQMLITTRDAKIVARLLTSQVDSLRNVLTVAEAIEHDRVGEVVVRREDDMAFLQYTSGSTGDPKGVMLTHANLLANIRADGEWLNVDSSDVFVSWLPLYHDMGLIGAWLGSLYHTPRLVIMSPLSFLSRPERWLWAVHRYGGTLSASPNFAFDLCVRRIDARDIEGLDLSRWRIVANGAEAISATTINAFAKRFAPYGFEASTMLPVYGLAECSVGLSFSPIGREPRIDMIDRDVLTREARAATVTADVEEPTRLDVVGCGYPLPGHEIRVVDGAGRELPERCEGQLEFRGPSATAGYFRDPEKTNALFHGTWLRTGDLAYIAGGEVFVTGRSKDLIIRAGRNIYPTELEGLIGQLDGIRAGCVAVFGASDLRSGTERLIVLAETRKPQANARERLNREINRIVSDVVTAPADDVVLVAPNTVLKTSSGKIRRAATRRLYEEGKLEATERAVWMQIVRLAVGGIRPQLRRASRFFRSMFYAGYAWVMFCSLGVCAWLFAMLPLPRRILWRGLSAMTRALVCVTATKIVVEGEWPPSSSATVIVANHQSYLDGPLMLAVLPYPVDFLVKGELQRSLFLRYPLRHIGARFIERFDREEAIEDLRETAEHLGGAYPLMVFPEGTFKRMPGVLPFHMGAFTATVAAGGSLVPIAVHGTRSILRANSWYPRRGQVVITIGELIRTDNTADAWSSALDLRDRAREHILRYCGEPDLSHESNIVDSAS